jgi:hypothetical protein
MQAESLLGAEVKSCKPGKDISDLFFDRLRTHEGGLGTTQGVQSRMAGAL